MDTLLLDLPPAMTPGDTSPRIEPNFSEPDKFDWSSDDSVLLGEQFATAVYRNTRAAIVIRQEGVGGDDDHFVILRDAEAVRHLVAALQNEIGEH
jgi:hypothetical protein